MVRLRLLGLVVAAFALVTACGAGDGGGNEVASLSDPATPSGQQQAGDGKGDDEQKMREFTKCMREHGVDMPDPTFGANGEARVQIRRGSGIDPDGAKFKAAQEACEDELPERPEVQP
jgi:hypothetical protein